MIGWFKKRAKLRASAVQLYGSSVAQARNKTFYAQWAVPDTIEGRYEVISLHLFLLVARLHSEGQPGRELARALLETFMTDLDDNMREMGTSDLKVPGHVKKAAAGLYDRFGDYRAAMSVSAKPAGGAGPVAMAGGDRAGNEALEQVVEARFAALEAGLPERSAAPAVREPKPEGAPGAPGSADMVAIAAYMRTAKSLLAQQASRDLFAGQVEFPKLPPAGPSVAGHAHAGKPATGSG